MQITVTLPDDFAQHADPGREALEALAIEGYKAGTLSEYQVCQMLGLARLQFDGFMKDRGIIDHAYGAKELQEDIETLKQMRAEGLLRL